MRVTVTRKNEPVIRASRFFGILLIITLIMYKRENSKARENVMGKVTLKIPPFFSYVMLPGFSDWFIQEREIGDKTSVCDLLNEIAAANPVFSRSSL